MADKHTDWARNMIEQKLTGLGYVKTGRNAWIQKERVVHIMHSSDFDKNYIHVARAGSEFWEYGK